jgi:2-polyprenyl-3-methyl-5-hydroxy-6-metoxy-1,4-benzoquinol methylase
MSAMHRHCPLLDQPASSEPLHDAPSPWQLRRCTETGFVFLANPPAQEQFQDEYAWEVTHEREADRRRQSEPAIHAMSTAMKTFRQRFLKRDKVATMLSRTLVQCASRKPSTTVRLVDVGCAYGTLAVRVATMLPEDVARRLEPIGIEISNHLAAKADETLRRRGGRCLHGTAIEGLRALEAGHADVIVLSCILEHEIEPLELLRQCHERLAPHGQVIIKIPNYASLGRLIRGPKWCGYRWPDHVNYFTPRTLRMIAERASLRVTRMNVFDRSPLSDSLYAVLGRDEAASSPLRRAA